RQNEDEEESTDLGKVGIQVTDLTPELAERLGFKSSAKGVVITHVDPDGVAASAGLHRGLLITKVDKQKVASAADLKEKIAAASLTRGILLQVQLPQGG